MSHPSALSGVFGQPFAEQVAFFRNKMANLIPTERWDDIEGAAHDTGFMVAGAAKADLLTDLVVATDKFISEGRGIEEFRRDFRSVVAKNGWTGWTGEGSVKGEAWRVGVIYRTNMYTSYSAGRLAQLKAGNFALWVYRHGASQEPRPEHLSWNGIALEPDHPFWETHYPPSDWGCSCYVVGADTAAGVKRMGGDPDKKLPANWRKRDPKTGAPVGIGRGWDYAPGASVVETVNAIARKIEQWPAMIGASFGGAVRPQIAEAWSEWLTAARAGKVQADGLVGTLDLEDVVALGQLGQAPASAELYVRLGIVTGQKAARHAKKGDAVEDAIFDQLPKLLGSPQAVLFDNNSEKLIYLLNGEETLPQFAVGIDYLRRGSRDKARVNVIVSAYRQKADALRNRLKSGELTLLRGSLDQ